jgi:diguanylate cyclase (GGDEF)-like protein/PAS domain S-box-containing protein
MDKQLKQFKILIVEDVATDAELIEYELRRGGLPCIARRVETEADFCRESQAFEPDLILSDFTLPVFDGPSALRLARESCPEVPFIFVSGTIGEERAIAALKQGATDYVLKTNLARLVPAVSRALQEAREHARRRAAEEALREREERSRLTLDNALDAFVTIDAEGIIREWNRQAEAIFGWSRSEAIGQRLSATIIPPRYRAAHERGLGHFLATGEHRLLNRRFEITACRRSGEEFPVELSVVPIQVGGSYMFSASIRDITERKQAEAALRQSEERLQAMLVNSPAIIYLKDTEGRFLLVNREFENLFHLTGEQIVGKTDHVPFPREIADRFRANDLKVLASKTPLEFEETTSLDDGLHTYISVKFPLFDTQGMPYAVGGISTDITARKRAEEELKHLAHHDALTGLANQALLKDHLEQALASARRHEQQVAVLFLDLDRFKFINDTLGHEVGDHLLQTMAHRLAGCVRASDTVARMGGDEFVVILTDIGHAEDAAIVVRKIFDVLVPDFVLERQKVFVTPSIGISLYPDDGEDGQTLLKHADLAMYRAKEQGRNNYQFYTPEMTARTQDKLALEHDLRCALARDELLLHYQPKVDLKSGQVVGLEALLRWQHPDRGLVSPAQFIPLAEDTGLIVPIGAWALQTACRQNKAWQEAGLPHLSMAVNLSARQFKQAGLVDTVTRVLEETAPESACLELEITESLLMQDTEASLMTLRALQDMGIRIALDDFGTGYSSLSYLKRFAIDSLKIDQSFVQDVSIDPNDAAIVKAIIAMTGSLGMRVVAEGVETQEQLEFLLMHGCDEIQGYYFSRPVSAEAVAALLREGRRLAIGAA